MGLYTADILYKTLAELGIIAKKQLDAVFADKKISTHEIESQLVEQNLISDENLGKVVADLMQVPFVNLRQTNIPENLLHFLPEPFVRKTEALAFGQDEQGLHVAMHRPADIVTRELIRKKAQLPIRVHYATKKDLDGALSLFTPQITDSFEGLIAKQVPSAKGASHDSAPIITIVNSLIDYAYAKNASDLHIEPSGNATRIRFRIDGIMHDIATLPADLHAQIVTRIKVMATLRTDEHDEPQDGKISYQTKNDTVDLRVSILPVTKGENIVMRLLSEKSRQYTLDDLGLNEDDLNKIRTAYQGTQGMILATGPTGSGKTTTLYAILKMLNTHEVNIMTIEDPVEYEVKSVSQIQVNEKTGLTFASGLRSIVRQDPDIVLVGEIRDEETADIAVNSAMTGHLVLSSLHTNNASTTIPRLFDLAVEPFLVASTIQVIIGQRLIRKICQKCRISETLTRSKAGDTSAFAQALKKYQTALFGTSKSIRIYTGKGCAVCQNTGYAGRVGIFEVLVIDDDIKKAITEKKDAAAIEAIAIKKGMTTMIEDGIKKIKQGVTTFEEVLRVTSVSS